MARKPRWDAPGAVHHVMVRGIERRPLFHDDADRRNLVARMEEVMPECGASCFGWVLMANHFHLIVQTLGGDLSRLMRRLNTGHAVRFNVRHDRVGFVFQNRFRSRLVESDEDLQGLVRYVHANPWQAGLVATARELERYPWSGHGALVGRRPPLAFERVADVLRLFADDTDLARRRLRAWMARASEEPAPAPGAPTGVGEPSLPRVNTPGGEAAGDECGDLQALVSSVCAHLGVSIDALRGGARRAPVARARALVCHVAVTSYRVATADVARAVGVTPSAVSHAIERGGEVAREERQAGFVPGGEGFSVTQHRPRSRG
jgi:REP element-mobilizing transposase RayT